MADEKKGLVPTEKKGFCISKLKTDDKMANEGVWIDFEGTFRIKIARIGSRKHKEFLVQASKPHMRKFQKGTIDNEIADKIMRKAISETILLDWDGLFDDKGEPVPFSKEIALQLLIESDDFYNEVMQLAQERDIFQKENEELAAKNS